MQQVQIVEPDSSSWQAHHATEELARYVEQMTGANVQVVKDSDQKSNEFLLGANLPVKPKPQPQADVIYKLSIGQESDRLKSLPGAEDSDRLRDGFIVTSKGQNELVIAATEPIGLLYGVYEYLERYCGCGFFWDGDFVPKRSSLPTNGIDVAVLPRWPVRGIAIYNPSFGLAKWHNSFRSRGKTKTNS